MKVIFKVMMLTFSITLFAACNKKEDVNTPNTTEHVQPKFVKEGELTFLKPDGSPIVKINIELALTEAEQEQGLMNRSFMNNDQGMLFVFDKDEPRGFWMRNTIIPLDIMYVNSKMEIIHIAENTEPFSERSIPSQGPAKYVIEVNAGFSAQYSITKGMKVSYTEM